MSGTNKLVVSNAVIANKSKEALAADLVNANEKAKNIKSIPSKSAKK